MAPWRLIPPWHFQTNHLDSTYLLQAPMGARNEAVMHRIIDRLPVHPLSAVRARFAPPIDDTLKTILNDCQPIWMPTDKPLRGWIIGIDPAPAGVSTTEQRLTDDLSMTTAAHLYHFVKRAGGRAILTRADETLTGSPNDRIVDHQIEIFRRANCDLCIAIRYNNTARKSCYRPSGPHYTRFGHAAELSAALVKALDAELFARLNKTITHRRPGLHRSDSSKEVLGRTPSSSALSASHLPPV